MEAAVLAEWKRFSCGGGGGSGGHPPSWSLVFFSSSSDAADGVDSNSAVMCNGSAWLETGQTTAKPGRAQQRRSTQTHTSPPLLVRFVDSSMSLFCFVLFSFLICRVCWSAWGGAQSTEHRRGEERRGEKGGGARGRSEHIKVDRNQMPQSPLKSQPT